MEHHPDAHLRVDADLDEVIARAEGAQLPHSPIHVEPLRAGHGVVEEPLLRPPGTRSSRLSPPLPAVLSSHACRDRAPEQPDQRGQVVGKLVAGLVETDRDHAAPDVDPDRRRDDGVEVGGYHAPDGRTLSNVGIGHQGNVAGDAGRAREHLRLAAGAFVKYARPVLDLAHD